MAIFGVGPTLTQNYLDRTDLRLKIQNHFLDHQNTSTSVVIAGMNGSGKTQLAAFLAQEASKNGALVVWITPTSLEHLHSLLVSYTKQLNVPNNDNIHDLIISIYQAIATQNKAPLIIFDDINLGD